MELSLLKAKIHRATVTESDLNYEGSITVDEDLLEQAGILVYEQVAVTFLSCSRRFRLYSVVV